MVVARAEDANKLNWRLWCTSEDKAGDDDCDDDDRDGRVTDKKQRNATVDDDECKKSFDNRNRGATVVYYLQLPGKLNLDGNRDARYTIEAKKKKRDRKWKIINVFN